jgi:hypothetical protein
LRACKKSGDLTTAIVPAGTSFPAVVREPFDLVIATAIQYIAWLGVIHRYADV